MKRWVIGSIVLGCLIGGITLSVAATKKMVGYPKGYRDWTHVKSMVIQEGHPLYESFGGIHHIYANERALKGMSKGGTFPDGAILVFDLLEAKGENNTIVEGSRKVIGVMEKRSKEFADTGGWGFEAFKGDTEERLVSDPKTGCYGCHEPQKKTDSVFSAFRR
ncbi:MAG: cytochrome P460 family protein [Candidatus Manganitrophaceae bacterium]